VLYASSDMETTPCTLGPVQKAQFNHTQDCAPVMEGTSARLTTSS